VNRACYSITSAAPLTTRTDADGSKIACFRQSTVTEPRLLRHNSMV